MASSEHRDQDQREPGAAVPGRSAGPPPPLPPSPPPVPNQAPETAPLVAWLRVPRPEAGPGMWRVGFQPRPKQDPDRAPVRRLLASAAASAFFGWLLWSLLYYGYLGDYWMWPLVLITPNAWLGTMYFVFASYLYYAIVIAGIAVFFGRLGGWPELLRRAWKGMQGSKALEAVRTSREIDPLTDPAQWPQLRADGAVDVAERLASELREGRMTDVDQARIDHAWRSGRARHEISRDVLARGAAACAHGSGARDIAGRIARHDLSTRQVRIGTAVDSDRNPWDVRGAGVALDPSVLGASAVVVGPSELETARVVQPVIESLALQALAGQSAVVAVTASGTSALQDSSFDVVVRVERPDASYGLDLYAGMTDADEAAGVLAEALVGDLAFVGDAPGSDGRRAATALAQLLGPWRAVHETFPDVAELRDLLDRAPLYGVLRADLERLGLTAQLRELDAFERRSGASDDPTPMMANRVALLDRPAFVGFLTSAEGTVSTERPGVFSLRHLEHPVRVRIDLPERTHADASRILARLVLAQFAACATSRSARGLFAGLVVTDAAQTITRTALRGVQRLQSAHAGALLALRTLADVPDPLRGPLLGSVGCRVATSGISSWDAEYFASAWGTEWVDAETVTHRQVRAEEPMTKVMHGLRKAITGKDVTTRAVSVRREERQRWSASDLSNLVGPGHVVMSAANVRGDRTPPMLTKLGN